ncbi:MAG: SpoIIE family protein phosphatase [Acidimicrobiia bacterium]
MTLRWRLVVLFGVFFLVVALAGLALAALTMRRDDARRVEQRLVVAQERVTRLASAYVDQETGERGYVIVQNDAFLTPYRQGRAEAARLLRALDADAGTDLRDVLAGVRDAASRWQAEIEQEIAAVRRRDAAEAVRLLATGTSKTRFDELRRELDRADRTVGAEVGPARDRTNSYRDLLNLVGGGFVVASLGMLVVLLVVLTRWITRPLAVVSTSVRSVRAGNLDVEIPEVGPPEVAELAADVDAMRERLADQLDRVERARESIEQNAQVALTLRATLETEVVEAPPGWSLAARLRAAEGVVAGDCYDLWQLPDGRIAVLMVDISGHGAIAGILALRCRELMRANLETDPAGAFVATARHLGDLGAETFITAFLGVIDPVTGAVEYANAGHPPPLIATAGRAVELRPTGPIIGPFPDTWETATTTIGPGAALGVYTDGLVETRGADGTMLGTDELAGLLVPREGDDADSVVQRCFAAVDTRRAGRLRDDVTVVVVCRSAEVVLEPEVRTGRTRR